MAERSAEPDTDTGGFAELARGFCQWIELDAGTAGEDRSRALVLLADLYRGGLALGPPGGSLSPMAPFAGDGSADPLSGDLADDLAAIWQALRAGLAYIDAGDAVAARRVWGLTFWSDWGPRVLAALATLHCAGAASPRFPDPVD